MYMRSNALWDCLFFSLYFTSNFPPIKHSNVKPYVCLTSSICRLTPDPITFFSTEFQPDKTACNWKLQSEKNVIKI